MNCFADLGLSDSLNQPALGSSLSVLVLLRDTGSMQVILLMHCVWRRMACECLTFNQALGDLKAACGTMRREQGRTHQEPRARLSANCLQTLASAARTWQSLEDMEAAAATSSEKVASTKRGGHALLLRRQLLGRQLLVLRGESLGKLGIPGGTKRMRFLEKQREMQ